jgi:hypothetical protein
MKIILDQVQPDRDRYVAYLKLMDGETVVTTKTVPYEPGEEGFGTKAQDKFKAAVTEWEKKQAALETVKKEIEAALTVVEEEVK